MPEQGLTFKIIKQVFYKGCFCIGLSATTYYSYAQVQTWISDTPAVIPSASLQSKVDALTSIPEGAGSGVFADHTRDVVLHSKSPPVLAKSAPLPISAPDGTKTEGGAPAVAAASPSAAPSASPEEADADKKEKDGEQKTEGEAAQAATGPVNALGQPYQIPSQDPQAQGPAPASSDPNAAANQGTSMLGMGPNSQNPNDGNEYHPVASGPSEGSGGGTKAQVTLTASEMNTLLNPITASFIDTSESVSGQVCTLGSQITSLSGCIQNTAYSIYTGRWNLNYGLSTNATFSISNGSSANTIKVNIGLTYQDQSQNTQVVSVSLSPTAVSVQTESKNGGTYKVYQINLPNIVSLNGESLSNVVATLMYSQTSGSAFSNTASAGSTLTFNRSHVETTSTDWSTTPISAGAQVIIANTVSYTMNLQ